MSKWISAEHELPPLDKTWEEGTYGEVLVMCELGIRTASYDKFTRDKTGSWVASSGETLRIVTHWMPLPAPPETPTQL